MQRNRRRYYAGAQMPNGTHALIVTDSDGPWAPVGDRRVVCDGESVFTVRADGWMPRRPGSDWSVTWAHDPADGEQGLQSITYHRA